MLPVERPGLRQYLNRNGYSLTRRNEANGSVSWLYDPAAQSLIDNYTLAEAQNEIKRQVDAIEAEKFDTALTAIYGFVPPPQQMLKWPAKEAEAAAWSAWDANGRVGDEPPTPTIDAEITAAQDRATRVAKTSAKAAGLESMRAAIEGYSVLLDDQVNAATDFDDLALIDINAGWPV